jgi:glycosyltransferase involved in cell wall biosynthesis
MFKIDIILPYKELFSSNGASAVSISVKNSILKSKFKKNINVYGQFVKEPFRNINFNGFYSNKIIHFSNNISILKQYIQKTKNEKTKKIIEIHNRPYLLNYLLKKKMSHCVVLYFHNDPLTMKGSKSIDDRLNILRNVSGIIFVSKFLKEKFLEGINETFENIFIIPNSLNQNFNIKKINKLKQILYVGRIVEEKGVHIYLDVIKNLSKKYTDWKFIIIGSSKLGYNSSSKYEKKILSNISQQDDNIEYLGYTSNEVVKKIMSESEILVIPSIWEEPFGITAIEGLSNKMAIISSEVGGLKEIVDGKGILIKDISEKKLLKELEYLINNPKKIMKYQNLSWKNYLFDQSKISALQDEIREKIFDKFSNNSH